MNMIWGVVKPDELMYKFDHEIQYLKWLVDVEIWSWNQVVDALSRIGELTVNEILITKISTDLFFYIRGWYESGCHFG